MKILQVRNVPDDTHAVLRRRAAAAGMSLQDYLLTSLNEQAARPTTAEVLARAAQRTGGRVSLSKAATQLRTERSKR